MPFMPPSVTGAPPMGQPRPMGPPPGTGPAAAPGAMAGNALAGMEKVKLGVKMLIESLPMLQLGSELQQGVMKAVQDIGKHVPEVSGGGDPQAAVQMLVQQARQQKAEPMQAGALQQMMGGGGAPPPGGPPGLGAGAPGG